MSIESQIGTAKSSHSVNGAVTDEDKIQPIRSAKTLCLAPPRGGNEVSPPITLGELTAEELNRFQDFWHRLLLSERYGDIDNARRRACLDFTALAATLPTDHPPAAEEMRSAHARALQEARDLVASGLLNMELPNGGRDIAGIDSEPAKTPVLFTAPEVAYEIHPAANLFPMMAAGDLQALTEDIKQFGLREPIVIYKHQILDGRNRLEACRRASISPTFVDWTGSGSIVDWILSVNLHRRHLTDTQRAVIAASSAWSSSCMPMSRPICSWVGIWCVCSVWMVSPGKPWLARV